MTSGRLPKIPRCLTWASCCSGSEGPVFCMQAINSAAKAFPGLSPFCFTHAFSCEKDGENRKWIANASALAAETVQSLTRGTAQQQKCQGCCHSGSASHAAASPCLFVDICELGGDVADCAAHGQKCPVPQVDLLFLGTSCKDMSRAAQGFRSAVSAGQSGRLRTDIPRNAVLFAEQMPTLSAFRECRRHGRQQGHGHEQHGHLFGRDFRPGV